MNSIDLSSTGGRPSSESRSIRAVPLPDPHCLLQALWGHSECDSIVYRKARDLADLHAELKRHRFSPASKRRGFDEGEIRSEIDRLVAAIDSWAESSLPRLKGGRTHSCSIGEIINDISMQFSDAWWTILHAKDEHSGHQAWSYFARVFEKYSEIYIGVSEGRVHLLDGYNATR